MKNAHKLTRTILIIIGTIFIIFLSVYGYFQYFADPDDMYIHVVKTNEHFSNGYLRIEVKNIGKSGYVDCIVTLMKEGRDVKVLSKQVYIEKGKGFVYVFDTNPYKYTQYSFRFVPEDFMNNPNFW